MPFPDDVAWPEARRQEFKEDCLRCYGRELVGDLRHWCYEWDSLPIDETCDEIESCLCYSAEVKAEAIRACTIVAKVSNKFPRWWRIVLTLAWFRIIPYRWAHSKIVKHTKVTIHSRRKSPREFLLDGQKDV